MKEVRKKAYPALFAEVASGRKMFDLRLADFDCKPGDILVLEEVSETDKKPTDRSIRKKVGYVLRTKELDFFPPEDIATYGYQVMSLSDEDNIPNEPETVAHIKNNLTMLQERALEISRKYTELNIKDGRGAWGGKEYVMGFIGDVGDLMKIVMAKENLRGMEDIDAKLAHELGDCLWSVLVLASYYGVQLEKEFLKTMDALEQRIANS